MSRPLILCVNDDGVTAPGLRKLVHTASQIGEVVVVAPDSPQSGQGHAITLEHPIKVNRIDLFGDIEAYECSGTPVDCVKLAKNVLLQDRQIDLCLSGINHGSNASINIIYSGTMSAAMEASLEGVQSIGFSLLDYSHEANFEAAAAYVKEIVQYILANPLVSTKLLNVNIPKLPLEEIKGFKICRQAEANWVEDFKEAIDPRGQKHYWMTGEFRNLDKGHDTDIYALNQGYISVVPIQHDLTNFIAMREIGDIEDLSI